MLLEISGATLAGRLTPFSAQVASGEVVHLVGPNGAGKSSLLAALAGLIAVAGEIRFAGRALGDWPGAALARQRAYLAQQQVPPGQMPVWHYLHMHAQPGQEPGAEVQLAIADKLQLGDKLSCHLHQLSGGEWQRVRLAAVLLQLSQPDGKLLLLDEPLSGLDIAQQMAFDDLLPPFTARGGSVVMSSHDLNHSLQYADRVWLLRRGQQAVVGRPRQVLTPENLSALYQVPFRLLEVEGRPMLTTLR